MNAPTAAILKLRGRALAEATANLVRLRAIGRACWRCARLLAAGTTCPDHGRRPNPWPRMRS